MDEEKKTAIPVATLIDRISSTDDAKLMNELMEEFNAVTWHSPGFLYFRLNPTKNRYNDNILLYDHTRVVLKNNPSGDYIHASYVDTTTRKHRFILTQAPLPETINDFWHMIAQERVQLIAAMCSFDEPNVANEDPFPVYWPSKNRESKTYNHVHVNCAGRKDTPSMTVSQLNVSVDHDPKKWQLSHVHLKVPGWMENGLPTNQLDEFIDMLWDKEKETTRLNGIDQLPPILIHCASGTSRSGQLAALATATEAIRNGWQVSLKDIICMVQTQRYGVLRDPNQVAALILAILKYSNRHKMLKNLPPAVMTAVMSAMKSLEKMLTK